MIDYYAEYIFYDGGIMREKLETLSLPVLRSIAKDKNIKGVSGLRKNELIDAIYEASLADGSAMLEEHKARPDGIKNDAGTTGHSANIVHTDSTGRTRQPVRRERNDRNTEDRHNNIPHNENVEQRADRTGEARKAENPMQSEERKDLNDESLPLNLQGVDMSLMDNGPWANGILEVMEGYGFIRCENFLPGDNDVYVSPSQIRKFNLKTGDILIGPKRIKNMGEKFSAILYLDSVNGKDPVKNISRPAFEHMTPIFPNERIYLEPNSRSLAMRVVDLLSPIGKGQRGMIVSQPKAGKTTLLKQIAASITRNNPEMHLIILLIDERPEEVTDIKESIDGENVEVIYSTFDELPERHKRVSEMVIERAKRLVEDKKDVIILLDSITRLARAYNITAQGSGRTLSGGLDPAALHMPKRFFGAARNMREGGSLTVLATALVETGSKMDDVIFEEFKGTGNMELVLDRKLSEKRIFPAIDIAKSGTRREDLLLTPKEREAMDIVRKALNSVKAEDAAERVLDTFVKTKDNKEFIEKIIHNRYV